MVNNKTLKIDNQILEKYSHSCHAKSFSWYIYSHHFYIFSLFCCTFRTMIPISKYVPARTNPSPRRVRSSHNPIPNIARTRQDRPPEIVTNRNAGGGGLRNGRTGGGQEQEGGEGWRLFILPSACPRWCHPPSDFYPRTTSSW